MNKMLGIANIIGALLLTSCGGGGSGSSGGTSGNGGITPSSNIQVISQISSLLGTPYSPSCIYQYGYNTILVKNDGSGTGVAINTETGTVAQLSDLPQLNALNGDNCLINFGQLTWYNEHKPHVVDIFDPSSKKTQEIDLSHTGISGSDISNTSFALDLGNNALYANKTFLNDGYAGFSRFSLIDPIITSFTQFDNSTYLRAENSGTLYGFSGLGNAFIQMYQADAIHNLPAIIVDITLQGSYLKQYMYTITDTANKAILAMATATDIVYYGNGSIIVNTGGVSPVLYSCHRSTTVSSNYTCDKTYTNGLLTSKYRIMRLLGANANNLYFLGSDLTNATLNIFSLAL